MREIVFDTETTGLIARGGRPHGRNRLHRDDRPGRDRAPLPLLFQSRAADAERGRGGPRPAATSSCPTSRASPTRPRSCWSSSAIRRWSRTMPSFDFGFLNHELERCGRAPVCMTRMVDTLVLARSRHPGAKHSLDALVHPLRRRPLAAGQAWRPARRAAARPGLYRADRRAADRAWPRRRPRRQSPKSMRPSAGRASASAPPRPHAASAEEVARHRALHGQDHQSLVGAFLAPTSERGAA